MKHRSLLLVAPLFGAVLVSGAAFAQDAPAAEASADAPMPPPAASEEVALQPPLAIDETPAEKVLKEVKLEDGQSLTGYVDELPDGKVRIRLVAGGELILDRAAVREIVVAKGAAVREGSVFFRDPNRTRYLYAPSAFALEPGTGYFSQKELFFSSVAVGVTDNLALLGGTVLPSVFAGSPVVIGGAKVALPVNDLVRVAGSAELFWTSDVAGAGGFAGGTVTVGTESLHASVNAGFPYFISEQEQDTGNLILVGAASARIEPWLGVVTENWYFPTSDDMPVLASLAVRFIGRHVAADVGLIHPIDSSDVYLPWLDFTYNWD